ncbi:MAG: hypothetical protein N3E37_02465 [Candidatus Micrarchaeota archaeon]|nr:hypothetical protein [Candidatus Micrarchaeota archaeon]
MSSYEGFQSLNKSFSMLQNLIHEGLANDTEILLINTDLSKLDSLLLYEVKMSFATKTRYFQEMRINNNITNYSFDHLNNKCIGFDEKNNCYMFYSYFTKNEKLKELVFVRLEIEMLGINFLSDKSFELSYDTKVNNVHIKFAFRHSKIDRFILPITSIDGFTLLKNYQRQFGNLELFAPYGFTISVDHFSIHPYIVKTVRDTSVPKPRYSDILRQYDNILFEKIKAISF